MTTLQAQIPVRKTAGYKLLDRAWHLLGLLVMLLLASYISWGFAEYWPPAQAWPLILLVSLAYSISSVIISRLARFPKVERLGVIVLTTSLAFLLVIAIIALDRLYYSRLFWLSSFSISIIWLIIGSYIFTPSAIRLGLVPGPMASELCKIDSVNWYLLRNPSLSNRQVAVLDGVVVDLHQELSREWIRFLAGCSIRGIPVFHGAVIFESLTGKVSLEHLSSGASTLINQPGLYLTIKRIIDIIMVVISAPIIVPILIVTAVFIKMGSPGPVFFWQERVGKGGKIFRMVKLRSMRVDADRAGAKFASKDDDRIIPGGKLMRKLRIDELPQFWNVLLGDMSIIGPRPEQVPFVVEYSSKIPYYQYRHLVKPGITGWAQVMHGYAASHEEAEEKLAYDLYYVKHVSVWLDLIIVYKTAKTILTGFGAR